LLHALEHVSSVNQCDTALDSDSRRPLAQVPHCQSKSEQ
jgi:hypothetical protein